MSHALTYDLLDAALIAPVQDLAAWILLAFLAVTGAWMAMTGQLRLKEI